MVSSGGFLFLVRVLIKYLNYSKPTIDQIRYEFDLRVKKYHSYVKQQEWYFLQGETCAILKITEIEQIHNYEYQ